MQKIPKFLQNNLPMGSYDISEMLSKTIFSTVDDLEDAIKKDKSTYKDRKDDNVYMYDDNDLGNDSDLFKKPRLDLIKEMNALFISAKAKVKKASEEVIKYNFEASEASFKPQYKNFLEYIAQTDPTPQSTIENMLDGYIEYVSHGIDLNNETNIQTFYAQTYKQFFQSMALKVNRIKSKIKSVKISVRSTLLVSTLRA